jgi:flagellar motor switch protein FliG
MIALVLARLNKEQAAAVLGALPSDLQADVTRRLAEMEKISPEVLEQIEPVLEQHLALSESNRELEADGAQHAAAILNLLDSSTEHRVLQRIATSNDQLAAQIKNLMFVFDDIRLLDDRCVQRLLKEVEIKDLARALKSASESVSAKIFANLSERAVGVIKEEIEFMGPVRLSDVEAAQQRIVDIVRRLEDEGLVVIAGRGIRQDVIL